MPTIRPFRLPALLLAAAMAAAPSAAQDGGVAVDASHLRSLQARLDSVASTLPPQERAAWNRLLLRAAGAPAASAEVRVTPVLEIGPGGGCDGATDEASNRVAIIIQGGRSPSSGIIVQGGRTPPREGIIVQGGRTPSREGIIVQGAAPRPNPAGTVAVPPRQENAPPPQSLARRIAELGARLSPEERGALDWLLTRAAAAEVRPDTQGGLPPGPCGPQARCRPPVGGSPLAVSLRQALGIDALAAGPGQVAPPSAAGRWILRY
jgi:hypothetical protein